MVSVQNPRDQFHTMECRNTANLRGPPVRKILPKKERLCSRLSPDDFLTFDGPTGSSVSPNDTRGEFFLHLGLHESNYRHRVLYRKMKSEARAGMERLFQSRKSLQQELIHDLTVVPPFSLVQMTEVAFQQEIKQIYDTASSSTKGIYDIVGGRNGNWVIRWMLWRVVQTRLSEETRASSSGTETDSSISVCSPAMEYSLPTPLSLTKSSPKRDSSWLSAYNYSDSEDWDESEVKTKRIKIKADPDPVLSRRRQTLKPRGYWDHVL